ncbi:MAG: hypothetical protein H6512_14050 [Acidimicrobiia bacterium]|nr:hypothetical protein [Acidimicrobiia bacterium]
MSGYWVPQISSKYAGAFIDGYTWDDNDILNDHLQLRTSWGDPVYLLRSSEWAYADDRFLVTIVGIPYTNPTMLWRGASPIASVLMTATPNASITVSVKAATPNTSPEQGQGVSLLGVSCVVPKGAAVASSCQRRVLSARTRTDQPTPISRTAAPGGRRHFQGLECQQGRRRCRRRACCPCLGCLR